MASSLKGTLNIGRGLDGDPYWNHAEFEAENIWISCADAKLAAANAERVMNAWPHRPDISLEEVCTSWLRPDVLLINPRKCQRVWCREIKFLTADGRTIFVGGRTLSFQQILDWAVANLNAEPNPISN